MLECPYTNSFLLIEKWKVFEKISYPPSRLRNASQGVPLEEKNIISISLDEILMRMNSLLEHEGQSSFHCLRKKSRSRGRPMQRVYCCLAWSRHIKYLLSSVVCCFIRPLEMLWMKTVFFLRREESFCSLHLIQFTISTAHSYPSSNSEWTCGEIMSSLVLQKWVKLLQFERLCPKLSRKCTMFCEVFWFNCCCQLVCSIVRISCVWVLHWYGYGKKIPLSIQLWYTI